MLKKITAISLLLLCLGAATAPAIAQEQEPLPSIYEKGLRFCEGTVAYKNLILVSNFGGESLNPLNADGKGYIMAIDGANIKTFIPPDGNLSAPKGMSVIDGHLFIADVCKVVVYNLRKLSEKPVIIKLADDDKFVNDIVAIGKMIVISVTDSGRLYGLDASNIEALSSVKPMLLGNVPGPNGLAVYESSLYIASYNPSGIPAPENVIYVANITQPGAPLQKLIENLPAGQYDGIALTADGKTLVFSSWTTVEHAEPALWSVNLENKTAARIFDLGTPFKGPADITIKNKTLWVPDLVASRVYRFDL